MRYALVAILFNLAFVTFAQNLDEDFYQIVSKDSAKAFQILKQLEQEALSEIDEQLIGLHYLRLSKFHEVYYVGDDRLAVNALEKADSIFQRTKDTLLRVKALNRYSYLPDHKPQYHHKINHAYQLALQIHDSTWMYRALCNRAYNEMLNGSFTEALSSLKEAEVSICKEDFSKFYPNLCMMYDGLYNKVGLYDLSLEYLEKYATFAYSQKDTAKILHVLHSIALNNYYLRDFEKAIDGYNEVLEHPYFPKAYVMEKFACYFNLSNAYNDSGQTDSALKYCLLAEKLMKESKIDYLSNKIDNLLSGIYANKKDFTNARKYAKAGLGKSLAQNKLDAASFSYLYLTNIELEQENYLTAEVFADSCAILAKASGRTPILKEVYQLHMAIADSTNDSLKHSYYANKLNGYEDSLLGVKSQLRIDASIARHDNIKLRYEKSGLDDKLEETRIRLGKSKNRIRLYLVVGLIIILILLIFFFISKRNEKRRHQRDLVKSKQENETLQRELQAWKMNDASIDLNKNELLKKLKKDQDWISFYADVERLIGLNVLELLSSNESISKTDCKYVVLMELKLSNKEIADLMNITEEGAKKGKYRARKKLSFSQNTG
ncbi:MAG: hypothetical protein MRY83_18895 [Flavobacteriales bacterium]|nr:hypothetical protein [Flavobacteriales bacterium]